MILAHAATTVVGLGIETMEPTGGKPGLSNAVVDMTFSHHLLPQIGWTFLAGAIAIALTRRRVFAVIAVALSSGQWLGNLVSGYRHHMFGPDGHPGGQFFPTVARLGLFGLFGVLPFTFLVV